MEAQKDFQLKINEIFYSIQGEGPFSGVPCVFIRTTGCQMRCSYCDTSYAFYSGKNYNLEEIEQSLRAFPCKTIEITGGEPLTQKASVIKLMNFLNEKEYSVLLETGGGIDLDGIPSFCHKIVDIKCPDSGESHAMNWNFLNKTFPNITLKFVLSSFNDYLFAKNWIQENKEKITTYKLYMSPVTSRLKAQDLAAWILKDGLSVTLQLQLHKLIFGDLPGV